METKKENKKGFWASLFSPKPCSCSCGNNLIIEEEEKPAASCCCEDNAATTKTGIKEVKILGPGCAKCKSTYQVIEKVINELPSGRKKTAAKTAIIQKRIFNSFLVSIATS